jgi:hypothetical protein
LRHITLEKHLNNWLHHVLRIISDDSNVNNSDRRMAKVLIESPSPVIQTTLATDEADPHRLVADTDVSLHGHIEPAPNETLRRQTDEGLSENLQQQIERALKEVFGIEVEAAPTTCPGASDPIPAEERE